jgi:hypothetical protein
MNSIHFYFWPFLIQLVAAAGVWVVFWYRKIGWAISGLANAALIAYGAATGLWGFAVVTPLVLAAQMHHLAMSRRESWTYRTRPVPRLVSRRGAGPRTRPVRHGLDRTIVIDPVLNPERVQYVSQYASPGEQPIGYPCPFGCGTYKPTELLSHLRVMQLTPKHRVSQY